MTTETETKVMTYSIVYCVGYSSAFSYTDRRNDCIDDRVFKNKSSAEVFLRSLRSVIEKNQLIASLVYVDIRRFEENEGEALERGDRLPDYPTRVENFRAARWEYYRSQFVDGVELTNRSDIYSIRQLNLVD